MLILFFFDGIYSPFVDGQDLKQNGTIEWSRDENPGVRLPNSALYSCLSLPSICRLLLNPRFIYVVTLVQTFQ